METFLDATAAVSEIFFKQKEHSYFENRNPLLYLQELDLSRQFPFFYGIDRQTSSPYT